MHRRTRYHIMWATMIIERRKGGWCSRGAVYSCRIIAYSVVPAAEGQGHKTVIYSQDGTWGVACPHNAPSLHARLDLSWRFTPPLHLLTLALLCTREACSRMARAQNSQIKSSWDAAGSPARPRRQPKQRVRPPTSPHPIRKKQPTLPIWARWHSSHGSKAGSGTNLAGPSHHRGRLRPLPPGRIHSLPCSKARQPWREQ